MLGHHNWPMQMSVAWDPEWPGTLDPDMYCPVPTQNPGMTEPQHLEALHNLVNPSLRAKRDATLLLIPKA